MACCPEGHQLGAAGRSCPRCRRDQVAELAAAADGTVPRQAIEAAVDAVAPSGQALRHLADALTADAAALASRRTADRGETGS